MNVIDSLDTINTTCAGCVPSNNGLTTDVDYTQVRFECYRFIRIDTINTTCGGCVPSNNGLTIDVDYTQVRFSLGDEHVVWLDFEECKL